MALSKYGVVFRMNTGIFTTPDGRRVVCGVKGMSDLLMIRNDGRAIWIEVKTANGRPSKAQLHFIERMKELHCLAGIARSVEDALRIAEVSNETV